jgi:hypothetical protein
MTANYDSMKTCEFKNLGGTVSSLEVSTAAAVVLKIYPSQVLQTNQMGKVEFQSQGSLPTPFQFQIACRTKLGERLTRTFLLKTPHGTPEEQP